MPDVSTPKSKVTEVLRRVLNEVPAVAAFITALATTVLTATDTVSDEASWGGFAAAVALALVRQFVSPAYPTGQKALEVANRADIRALEELARTGDEVAAEVLVRLQRMQKYGTPNE